MKFVKLTTADEPGKVYQGIMATDSNGRPYIAINGDTLDAYYPSKRDKIEENEINL